MKKILFTILLQLIITNVSAQQFPKLNELQFGVGHLFNVKDFGDDTPQFNHRSPIYSLGYMYEMNDVWSLGVSLSYMHSTINTTWDEYDEDNNVQTFSTKETDNMLFILANAKAKWLRHRIWNFYSKMGVGPSITIGKTTRQNTTYSMFAAFQFSPIGFETGNEKIRAYIEFGFGQQGIVQLGLAHKF